MPDVYRSRDKAELALMSDIRHLRDIALFKWHLEWHLDPLLARDA